MHRLSIRPRAHADFSTLAKVVNEVHLNDQWPKCKPDNWESWLQVANEKAAWVLESEGNAVGHISVATPPATTSMNSLWQSASKQDANSMIEISRLFISPQSRGSGGGRILFDTAVEYCESTKLAPVLYTGEIDHAAQRLYEQNGWKQVGEIPELLPDGSTMVMLAYVQNAISS